MLGFSLLALPSVVYALAMPSPNLHNSPQRSSSCSCDLSGARLVFPDGSAIASPSGAPSFIGLGIGAQNYTCTTDGVYSNIGAVAKIFDISCLLGTLLFDHIQDLAIAAWQHAQNAESVPSKLCLGIRVLGDHFFITNPVTGSGISPKWDFTASLHDSEAFVVAAKSGSMPAPTGSSDIDWLVLDRVLGSLATQVYRVDTRGGQPPAKCTSGSAPITVKYTAKYCEC
ncbi:uncharacterized protein BT62DRAFT_965253 [Guyanagaster necrorhizus]|uniref:Malate dehydrogenase n=1 Tax=Guyanagaster necrorhizus TaxID=856835 RepID=A0A9P7VXF2_9AGAR|nr:uncharacterized protein BT62DRAFT_965253 [Guyanagaster necrorhizus MCA 3950]KAG7448719.1 hypothetical protein BT62DRAFT_965253 [Guyanagaster necrorhizus MCA 3950]